MTDAVSSVGAARDVLRKLGPTETYFWLSDQNSWKHFVSAVEVVGETSVASWEHAIASVQRRHPLLQAAIEVDADNDPCFVKRPDLRVPLRVIETAMPDLWLDEMEEELSTPIATGGLYLRMTLLHAPKASTLLITLHHAIADGASATILARDLIQALAGLRLEALPMPEPQEALLTLPAGAVVPAPPSPLAPRGERVRRDRSALRIQRLQIPPMEGRMLRQRARTEGTTVHGALVTALVMSGRRCSETWRKAPVRVVSPVNARPVIGRGDECALSIIFPSGAYDPRSIETFWDTARKVPQDLAGARSAEGLAAAYAAFDGLIASRPGVAGIADAELDICAMEMMVSNLGPLPFDSSSANLRLAGFWGPSVLVGVEKEQMIGASAIDDAISLLHTSSDWPAAHVIVVCSRCDRRDVYRRDDLIASSPKDIGLTDLLQRLVATCENQRVAYLRDKCEAARLAAE